MLPMLRGLALLSQNCGLAAAAVLWPATRSCFNSAKIECNRFMTVSFSSAYKLSLWIWCVQAKRFELNAVSVATIRPGAKLCHRQSAALNRSGVAMPRNRQNPRTPSNQSANLQRRYGYLEKAFDGDASHCLAVNRLDAKYATQNAVLSRLKGLDR